MFENMMDTIGFVQGYDPELGACMERELERQRQNIELIARENIVSPAVMAAMGSVVGLGFTGYRRAMELLLAMKKQPTAEP